MLTKERLACDIGTMVYDKYLIVSYGIKECNINRTEGDLYEKIIRKSILDFGFDCGTIPSSEHIPFSLGDLPKIN